MKTALMLLCVSASLIFGSNLAHAHPLRHHRGHRSHHHYSLAGDRHHLHHLHANLSEHRSRHLARRRKIAARLHRYASPHLTASLLRQASGGVVRASYYDTGTRTASGERFRAGGFTAAHRTLPFGTRLRLTNPRTGRSVTVRINDRGPFVRGRGLDVSRGAAAALGMIGSGTATLRMARL
jgi:rare lipoprotein A